MKSSGTIDEYILNCGEWQASLNLLRDIICSTGLQETVKWGGPVFQSENKNIAGMAAFKSYVAIWFYQGALLKDEEKKLMSAQEGVTKALRQWRFSSIDEIAENAAILKAYLEEAIKNQKQGKEIKPDKNKPLVIPEELNRLLSSNLKLKQCFEAFSVAKRREFAEYILAAKREETRLNRLDKVVPMILSGIGLYDKYLRK
ncbi:MAG: hypothetical protein A2W90_11475 [Bacteroidetes bacterium GWF2_42_66]|nr:MAG: hypothetical protein A2W92_13480 [Bacteroidetes bacterium GWA2_42_15]OFY01804.1 MAG: hypothetical protein A2W89_23095 [Bacteroidetes bacterium GWE2_42_39]OFY44902.1 MAG: hypothetical protein A2W90_11475 [Bacteroidetes bacterium GWF2_42_66]HBL76029.1 hypothetical protein [Prolixibacteraceae bacterium]HCR89654.1 hypothetical protein [Prolixibacteraceae bacterium]